MRIKVYITKALLLRLAVFLVLVGAAFVLDTCFEKNPAGFDPVQAETGKHNPEPGEVFILAQNNLLTAKSSVQKIPTKKLHVETHTKFLRKYYSTRNYQVLKAEVITQTTPLIASYHFLIYQTYFYSPGEDPLS